MGTTIGAVKAALLRARGHLARASRADAMRTRRAVSAGLVIAMFRPASSPAPAYFILLKSSGGRVSLLRDFRYIPYIARDARFVPVELNRFVGIVVRRRS
jgi:hypothetical protein